MSAPPTLRQAIDWARSFAHNLESSLLADQVAMLADAAESTLPKTRMVEVWYVTYAWQDTAGWHPGIASVAYESRHDAEEIAAEKSRGGGHAVRITGPHAQEIAPGDVLRDWYQSTGIFTFGSSSPKAGL